MGMNLNIKARWADALRGGDFKQGQNALRSKDDEYCCLGVLCELYRLDQQGGKWTEDARDGGYMLFNEEPCVPPDEVMKWAGLENYTRDVHFEHKAVDVSLSRLNDDGTTFAELADIIEEKL